MGWMQEFKAFAMRGNVVDLAVGVIIGGAFGKIVGSMVSDVMMPIIGVATGGVNFADKKLELRSAVEGGAPAVTLNYGTLIDAIIYFLIVAMCLFLVIKAINSAKKKEVAAPAAPPAPPRQEVLLEEIRDLLRKR